MAVSPSRVILISSGEARWGRRGIGMATSFYYQRAREEVEGATANTSRLSSRSSRRSDAGRRKGCRELLFSIRLGLGAVLAPVVVVLTTRAAAMFAIAR